jgi:dolichol-phosphate mannosyltransferase
MKEYMTRNTVLIFVPTYNERDNVALLYKEIKQYNKDVDILFCDDNSPDGTGAVLDEIAAQDSTVHVVHRPTKLGLGTAHIKAFSFAKEHQYTNLVTMDADFTHHPSYIAHMLQHQKKFDVVIGSRYAHGGRMSGWGLIRLPFTYFWRNVIKFGLGMRYDCTGAFRLYKVHTLDPRLYANLNAKGFAFCMESLYRMHQAGLKITEIPIHARNRTHGKSKLSLGIMKEVACTFFRLLMEPKRKSF